MSDTNNSYLIEIDRNQLEEDLEIVISDMRWQDILSQLDDVVANIMAGLGKDE